MYNHPHNLVRLKKQCGGLVSYSTNDTDTIELQVASDLSGVDVIPLKLGSALVCLDLSPLMLKDCLSSGPSERSLCGRFIRAIHGSGGRCGLDTSGTSTAA